MSMCVFDQGRGDSEEEVVQGGPKTIGQLAVLSAGSLTTVGPPAGAAVGLDEGLVVGETVVGLDKGLAVRESVVGLDESLVVGETVMGLDLDESDEEIAQGGPINEPSNEPINLDEKFFFDQHNDLCEVCNQPGFLLCCEKCNLVFHMHYVGLQVEPEVYLCTYCLADDNPSESQPSVYELQRMRRIENKDDVDDDEDLEDDVSIYTYLSGPSTEKNSIYDNWPIEEYYTVREADIPQETRELLIVRRLNTLKDSPRSDETNKRMKKYTAELKESKMKHEGPHDKLNQMFVPKRGSHRLKSTDRGKKGVQATPINTNIDCPGQRPSIKAMVDFAESIDGAILETGVIFRDVSKRFTVCETSPQRPSSD